MKKIFFAGQHFSENGPSEVNKNIIRYLPKGIAYIRYKNKYLMRLESLLKILWCNVYILSALGHKEYEIRFAKFFKKKIIYIMHGFGQDDGPQIHARETKLLPITDKILCVSRPFCELAKHKFPQYAYKMDVLTNGISWDKIQNTSITNDYLRNENEIVLVGGGRLIKQNLPVCLAIEELNDEMCLSLHVNVYGEYNMADDSPKIASIPHVTFHGLIPHRELLRKYKSSKLLIQNSVIEPFGLAVIEALVCGCDILVGKNTGAIEVLNGITDDDIIQDYSNISEIKRKIINVLEKSNNSRLFNSIDKEKTTWQTTTKKMIEYAESI